MNEDVKQILIDVISEGNSSAYSARRNHLKTLFAAYNTMKQSNTKNFLDGILEADKQYCINSQNERLMREHNAFVIKYLSRRQSSFKEVARYSYIDERTAFSYCDRTLERLMIFAYGIDGIKWHEQQNI